MVHYFFKIVGWQVPAFLLSNLVFKRLFLL
jgi:hypothetical protein